MKTLTKTIALGLVTTALIGGTAVVASAAPKGPVAFGNFDSNKDGAISKDEFTAAVTKMQAKNAKDATAPKFEAVDTDKNGSINKTELATAQSKHGHGATSGMSAHKGVDWNWQ